MTETFDCWGGGEQSWREGVQVSSLGAAPSCPRLTPSASDPSPSSPLPSPPTLPACFSNVFPSERTIVNRERSKQGYRLLPYLLSKLAAELPIGAIFPALFGSLVYPATGLNPRLTR